MRLKPVRLRGRREALLIVEIEAGSRAEGARLVPGDAILARDAQRLRVARTLELVRGGVPIVVATPPDPPGVRAA